MYAIDLFCGAGGFSEGILQAGFHIVFSSDKSEHVMNTYKKRHEQLGLFQGINTHFELADIRELKGEFILKKINKLDYFLEKNKTFKKGDIDVIFGGPPCQGFSIAGKRDKSDPRNVLFKEYLRVIKEIEPNYIVMENVTGFMSMQVNPDFKSFNGTVYKDDELVSKVVQTELEGFGYTVLKPKILDASDYGVPQRRHRVIVLAYKNNMVPLEYPLPTTYNENQKITVAEALAGISMKSNNMDYADDSIKGRTPHFNNSGPISHCGSPFNIEESKHNKIIKERFSLFKQGESVSILKNRFLERKNAGELVLDVTKYPNLFRETVFTINTINDLKVIEKELYNYGITMDNKKLKIMYKRIKKIWEFDCGSKPFLDEIKKPIDKLKIDGSIFISVFKICKKEFNKSIDEKYLEEWFLNKKEKKGELDLEEAEKILNALLTNKNSRTRLHSQKLGPTMLTLPDDFIHPTLNKILNVREMARIQSFDDSFEFLGKRTTGGEKRKDEVPQFTQVGNAVPPLLAYAIAKSVKRAVEMNTQKNNKQLSL